MRKWIVVFALLLVPLKLYAQENLTSGIITANGQSVIATVPIAAVGGTISISGTWTGTATFRFTTVDGIVRDVILSNPTSGSSAATTTANGSWIFPNPGWRFIGVYATASMTGTMTVNIYRGVGVVAGGSSGGGGGSTSVSNFPTAADTNALSVRCVNTAGNAFVNCSAAGASKTDDAAFSVAVDTVQPTGLLFNNTSPDSVNEGDTGIPRMSANRNAFTTIRDAAGNERGLNINGANAAAMTLYSSIGDELAPAVDATQGGALVATGPHPMLESKVLDGSALPNNVTEGQPVRAAGSLAGIAYTMATNAAGTDIGIVAPGATAAITSATTPYYFATTASTNCHFIKASPGNIYNIYIGNTTSTTYFFRLYNLTADPTASSATGFVRSYPVPPNGFVLPLNNGLGFSTGIGYCMTLNAASTDNNASVVGLYVNVDYK